MENYEVPCRFSGSIWKHLSFQNPLETSRNLSKILEVCRENSKTLSGNVSDPSEAFLEPLWKLLKCIWNFSESFLIIFVTLGELLELLGISLETSRKFGNFSILETSEGLLKSL